MEGFEGVQFAAAEKETLLLNGGEAKSAVLGLAGQTVAFAFLDFYCFKAAFMGGSGFGVEFGEELSELLDEAHGAALAGGRMILLWHVEHLYCWLNLFNH